MATTATTSIEITDGGVRFKYVRRHGDPFHWDVHVWLSEDHGWGNALDVDTDGRDVLWACAELVGTGSAKNEAG